MIASPARLAVVVTVAVTGCAGHENLGTEGVGVGVTLNTMDAAVTDRVVERAQRDLEIDLRPIVAQALVAARTRAREILPDHFEVTRALDRAKPEEIGVSWRPGPFTYDATDILTAGFSYSGWWIAERVAPPRFPDGVCFLGEVQVQVVPWPRDTDYSVHPELLMAQATVAVWQSDLPGAQLVAEAIARRLADEVAFRVKRAAEAEDVKVLRMASDR